MKLEWFPAITFDHAFSEEMESLNTEFDELDISITLLLGCNMHGKDEEENHSRQDQARVPITITLSKQFHAAYWDKLDYYLQLRNTTRSELTERLLKKFIKKHKEEFEAIPDFKAENEM